MLGQTGNRHGMVDHSPSPRQCIGSVAEYEPKPTFDRGGLEANQSVSYLLCHHCLNWVEPLELWCPQCHQEVRADEPDPQKSDLADAIGRPLQYLGTVNLRRRDLPPHGLLFETSGGLLFVPTRDQPNSCGVLSEPAVGRILQFVRRLLYSLDRRIHDSAEAKEVSGVLMTEEPSGILGLTSVELAHRFMSDPCLFFIRRTIISSIRYRRRDCVITRSTGRPLRISPEGDPALLRTGLQKMHDADHQNSNGNDP